MGKTRGPVRLSEDERKTLNLTDPCKRLPEREREREGERERERERERKRERRHTMIMPGLASSTLTKSLRLT